MSAIAKSRKRPAMMCASHGTFCASADLCVYCACSCWSSWGESVAEVAGSVPAAGVATDAACAAPSGAGVATAAAARRVTDTRTPFVSG